jgi:hypothetical protein
LWNSLFGRNDETDRYNEIVRTANTNNGNTFDRIRVGRRLACSLAEGTGGRPFVRSNQRALASQLVRDSGAYYLLGYRSPAPAVAVHRIKVR